MSQSLKLLCETKPEARFRVVITIDPAKQEATDPVLRHSDVQAIPNLPGVLAGELTGSEILTLASNPAVENIVEDFDVHTMAS
ncbi:MAG: hypothetical protein KF832_27915 [Caldilineaceae bacterium]|nr:hypothetical protein [Caldilineaceae bacterium]